MLEIKNKTGTTILTTEVLDTSYRSRVIMGENNLTLYFNMPVYIEIPVGSYCMYQDEKYSLLRPQNLKKNNSRDFEFTLILESAQGVLGNYKFRDTTSKRLKFSNTAKPQEHLAMLVWNLNQRDSGWSVGEYIESIERVVSFNHTYCSDALRMIAEAFDTEFEIVGKVIHLRKTEYNKDVPLSLSYGQGKGFKSGVTRTNFDKSKAVEILYVQGGNRNIDATEYGSQELLLPKFQQYSYNGRTYVSDSLGYSIKRLGSQKPLLTNEEDSLDLSNIYPSRIGTISTVVTVNESNHFYDFIDNSIPNDLNYSQCLISGEKMSVIFQTGMMAGKEFDVSYNHSAKRFAITPYEIDGVTMPSELFKPVQSDTYVVFGISLPDAYVCNNSTQTGASWDMFKEAAKYMYENEDPRFSFTGEMDGIWAKKHWEDIVGVGTAVKLGGYVSFTDPQFQIENVLIRIIGIKDYVNSPFNPTLELSNVTVCNETVLSDLKKIKTNEVVVDEKYKKSIEFTKKRFREAMETENSFQYLLEAIQEGDIEEYGGLLLANIMAVKNLNGIIRGGLSGLDSENIGAWFGGTYAEALADVAKTIFYKDGTFRLADGKIVANAEGGFSLEFETSIKKYTSTGEEENVNQTLTINNTTGVISLICSDGDAVVISSQGIFTNRAGMQASTLSNGLEIKAAVVGHGVADLNASSYSNKSTVVGVYGDSQNVSNSPAPSWGGYFKKLYAKGFYVACRTIDTTSPTTTQLTEEDYYVACYNSANVEIYLPVSPQEGQTIEVKMCSTGSVNIISNGRKIFTNEELTSYLLNYKGKTVSLVNDRGYWQFKSYALG